MSDEISPEIFNHLVGLAALELTADEGEYLRRQLNNQLNAIRELEAIPLSADVPLASHGVPYTLENSTTPREDEWRPYPNVQAILAQAPQFEEGYIVVPDIPHTTLE
ncbi:MAG: aspartyl/glutamyl-tRNA amidotransferase subunit C [Anaerolineaceae bacterium]